MQPPGHTSMGGDCNDASAWTYPGAPEINDGVDNQCPGDDGHGLEDEISGVCGFFDPTDSNEFSWPAQGGATHYEVARSSDPRFIDDCMLTETMSLSWVVDEPVQPGVCRHYLVRPSQPQVGSWGADSEGVERTTVCP